MQPGLHDQSNFLVHDTEYHAFPCRYMKASESISALRNARKVIRNRNRKLARMKQRLDVLISKGGIELGSDMEEEMSAIITQR